MYSLQFSAPSIKHYRNNFVLIPSFDYRRRRRHLIYNFIRSSFFNLLIIGGNNFQFNGCCGQVGTGILSSPMGRKEGKYKNLCLIDRSLPSFVLIQCHLRNLKIDVSLDLKWDLSDLHNKPKSKQRYSRVCNCMALQRMQCSVHKRSITIHDRQYWLGGNLFQSNYSRKASKTPSSNSTETILVRRAGGDREVNFLQRWSALECGVYVGYESAELGVVTVTLEFLARCSKQCSSECKEELSQLF